MKCACVNAEFVSRGESVVIFETWRIEEGDNQK